MANIQAGWLSNFLDLFGHFHSVCLSVCLSVYLSIYLSVWLSVCLVVCLSVFLPLILWWIIGKYLYVCLCVCVCIPVPICVCVWVCVDILVPTNLPPKNLKTNRHSIPIYQINWYQPSLPQLSPLLNYALLWLNFTHRRGNGLFLSDVFGSISTVSLSAKDFLIDGIVIYVQYGNVGIFV